MAQRPGAPKASSRHGTGIQKAALLSRVCVRRSLPGRMAKQRGTGSDALNRASLLVGEVAPGTHRGTQAPQPTSCCVPHPALTMDTASPDCSKSKL